MLPRHLCEGEVAKSELLTLQSCPPSSQWENKAFHSKLHHAARPEATTALGSGVTGTETSTRAEQGLSTSVSRCVPRAQ